jgi:hypothetical protein
MSDVPQTLALIVLGQLVRGRSVSTTNRMSVAMKSLLWKQGSGQNVSWNVKGSGQNAENYSEGAAAANFNSDAQIQAILGWGRVRSNFTVTGTAQRAAQSHEAGPDGMTNLIMDNIVDSSAALASKINQQFFSGTGSNQITGLDDAIAQDDNTYATLARGSYSYWRPTVVDPGVLTMPSFALIERDLGAIYDACGESPNLAFCKTNVFNTIRSLFHTNIVYVTELMTPRGVIKLQDGFQGIEIDGCVFIKDKDATANRIYYLNTNYIHFEYAGLKPNIAAALAAEGISLNADDGYGVTPMGIQCQRLAKLGDSDSYTCFSELQLIVKKPNAFGCRKNVQVAA